MMEQSHRQTTFAPTRTYRQFVYPADVRDITHVMATESSTCNLVAIHVINRKEPERRIKITTCETKPLPFLETPRFISPATPETLIHCLIRGIIILTGDKGTYSDTIRPQRQRWGSVQLYLHTPVVAQGLIA